MRIKGKGLLRGVYGAWVRVRGRVRGKGRETKGKCKKEAPREGCLLFRLALSWFAL